MGNLYNLQMSLIIALLTGVISCGNNQDNAANSTTDITSEENMPENLNVNNNLDTTMPGNDMEMTGMDMQSMGNMSGTNNQMLTDDMSELHTTALGNFQVSIKTELDPIPINQIQSWTVHLETPAGVAVDDAEITVAGGMPAHNHGMPTSPRVTRGLGNGDYLVEGVQFQMPGHWVVTLNISADGKDDSVEYKLMLQP
jgi:uncharacterized protein involved in copper resistance